MHRSVAIRRVGGSEVAADLDLRPANARLGNDFDAFAGGLRAALRQAPKVILVGEMRDRETMEIGLTAAETGHLVMSTIHTVDAGQAVNA